MLELYLLRQLAAFKEYGTLSEAAERLYLSQPALSRNMRKLEEEIGVPLFVRSRRTISFGVCAPAPIWKLTPLLS